MRWPGGARASGWPVCCPVLGPTAPNRRPPSSPHPTPRLPPPSPGQIYAVCQTSGRIAYKRAGGSRLITANDHWKSQIRHALYTGDRFQR